MNRKLLEYLSQVGKLGNPPKRSPEQNAELGIPDPDVDMTMSQERLDLGSPDGFADTPPELERRFRMRRLMEATNKGDTDEVLTLRKQYQDELNRLNNLVNR